MVNHVANTGTTHNRDGSGEGECMGSDINTSTYNNGNLRSSASSCSAGTAAATGGGGGKITTTTTSGIGDREVSVPIVGDAWERMLV